MKYIDADRLRAEIEQLLEFDGTVKTDYYIGKRDAELVILSFLDSLQQEQEQYVISGQVFGATDIEQLYKGKVYIVSNLVQDTEFGLSVRDKVKMLLIKD